jgi:OOP family OmpA-OmpF porin
MALALAACRGGSEPAPAPTPTPTDTATASIIRPEVVVSPMPDLPPAPLAATIGFPEGGATLDAAARAAIDTVLESEQLGEGWPVVLRGHSDSSGRDTDNLAVSRRRAEAVADYLVGHGVAEERISVIALGEQNPATPNAHPDGTPDEEGRARNRRVEIAIAPPARPEATRSAAPQDEQDGEAEP